jgi:hypothetical protein
MRSSKKEGGVRKAGWFHTSALVLYVADSYCVLILPVSVVTEYPYSKFRSEAFGPSVFGPLQSEVRSFGSNSPMQCPNVSYSFPPHTEL